MKKLTITIVLILSLVTVYAFTSDKKVQPETKIENKVNDILQEYKCQEYCRNKFIIGYYVDFLIGSKI